MPVNSGDHLERQRRMSYQDAQERRICQCGPPACECCSEDRPRPIGGVDRNADAFTRDRDTKCISHVHVHERRDIKNLLAPLIENRPGA